MDISSFILGGLVLLAALVLEWRNRRPAVAGDLPPSELDASYYARRTRQRRLVHLLLGIIAVLAVTAGIVGPGREFILLWASVPLVVLLIVVLAMLDAFQTHRYHLRKLPEIRKASFPESNAESESR